jgi:diguanylate cyclase (GGDEF)-like protein/PAS domain S-box-containing protein
MVNWESLDAGQVDAVAGGALRACEDLLLLVDTGLVVRFASEGARRILGYDPTDLVGRHGLDIMHPDDLGRVTGIVERIKAGFPPRVAAIVKVRHADGRFVACEMSGGDFSVDGEPAGFWVVARPPVRAQMFAEVLDRVLAEEPLSTALSGITGLLPDVGERVSITCWASTEPPFTVGHRLPAALSGAERRPGSPWDVAATTGVDAASAIEDLEPQVAELARREGFAGVSVTPVADIDGAPSALITLWAPKGLWGAAMVASTLGVRELVEAAIVIRLQVERLRRTARCDALTGLANRLACHDFLREQEEAQAISVLYIDLDGFKDVNDTYGHAAGDTLLKAVARRLEASVRSTDLVARLGGDEFAVICKDLPTAEATALSDRILETVRQPVEYEGLSIAAGASIGIASAPRGDITLLFEQADEALYEAKRAGRNIVRFAG